MNIDFVSREQLAKSDYFLNASLVPRITLSIAIILIAWILIYLILPSDGLTSELENRICQDYIVPVDSFAPEPRERAIYFLTLILLPASITLLTILAWNMGERYDEKNIFWRISLHPGWQRVKRLWLPILLYFVILAKEHQFGMTFTLMGYTIFYEFFHSDNSWLFLASSLLLLLISFEIYYHSSGRISKVFSSKPLTILMDSIALLSIILFAYRLTFIPETTGVEGYSASLIHIGALMEPAVTSYLSTAIAAVDMVSQYGGLVEFAKPFLHAASGDPIGIFWFSYFTLIWSLICLWLSARRLLASNATLALFMTLAVIYLTGIKFQHFVCFQCVNFRWFWPSFFLLLAAYEIPRNPRLCWLPYALFPMAIYWNPETGLAATFAWMGWRILARLLSIISGSTNSNWIGATLSDFFMSALSFAAGMGALAIYFLYNSNKLLEFSLLFQYARDFYELGFYMLPMPLISLWNVYMIMGVILFSIGLQQYLLTSNSKNNDKTNHEFMVFAVLLFSLLFAYYQGRSFYGNLLAVSYPLWLALIAWIGMTQASIKDGRLGLLIREKPFQSIAIALFCLSTSALIFANFRLPPTQPPFIQDAEGKASLIKFIERTSDGNKPVFISYSSWRLGLLSKSPLDADISPLAGILRRDQLNKYFHLIGAKDVAVYYDLNTENILLAENNFFVADPLYQFIHEHFIFPEFPIEDVYIGNQARLVRLRYKQ